MSNTECPKCGRDISDEYDEYMFDDTCQPNKYIEVTNYHAFFDGSSSRHEWDVKCICPKCKKRFQFSDSDI